MPLQFRSHTSEDSQRVWLENEGAILGRHVPVSKGKKGSRLRLLYCGEARLKMQRGCGLAVMTTAYRRLCTITPQNIQGLREARLTRNERDLWDRTREYRARQDELDAAKDMQKLARSRNEKLEALERRRTAEREFRSYLGMDDAYEAEWEEIRARVLREMG